MTLSFYSFRVIAFEQIYLPLTHVPVCLVVVFFLKNFLPSSVPNVKAKYGKIKLDKEKTI